MSGRIVGEVMDHAAELRAAGVTQRGFLALLTIAEGCRDDRVGWVARTRLASVLGASERTATRAVADLVAAGVVEIVAKGRRTASGGVSNTYRIAPFGPAGDVLGVNDDGNDGTPECPVDPVDNSVNDGNDGTPECPVESVDKPVDSESGHVSEPVSTGHIEPNHGTPWVSHYPYPVKDSSRGYVSRERNDAHVPDVPPSKRCMIHHDADRVPPCGDCADARRAFEAWDAARVERLRVQAAGRRSAVQACGRCDSEGWLDLGESVARCDHRPALRVVGE